MKKYRNLTALLFLYSLPIILINSAWLLYSVKSGRIEEGEVKEIIYNSLDSAMVFSTVFWILIFLL